MQIPWLTRPPTAEEVAAHAKAYPILGNDGVWLYVPPRHAIHGPMRPQLRLLHTTSKTVWTSGGNAEEGSDARWLPCTAEGIPLCLLAAMAALVNWSASIDIALEHLTEALEASSDWEDELPVTRAEMRKARDLLRALGKQ